MGAPKPQHNVDPSRPPEHLAPLANPRHKQFAQAYAGEAHGNAAEAYRLAGYGPKNAKVAGNCGLRLLENVGIRERVKTLRAAIVSCAGTSGHEINVNNNLTVNQLGLSL